MRQGGGIACCVLLFFATLLRTLPVVHSDDTLLYSWGNDEYIDATSDFTLGVDKTEILEVKSTRTRIGVLMDDGTAYVDVFGEEPDPIILPANVQIDKFFATENEFIFVLTDNSIVSYGDKCYYSSNNDDCEYIDPPTLPSDVTVVDIVSNKGGSHCVILSDNSFYTFGSNIFGGSSYENSTASNVKNVYAMDGGFVFTTLYDDATSFGLYGEDDYTDNTWEDVSDVFVAQNSFVVKTINGSLEFYNECTKSDIVDNMSTRILSLVDIDDCYKFNEFFIDAIDNEKLPEGSDGYYSDPFILRTWSTLQGSCGIAECIWQSDMQIYVTWGDSSCGGDLFENWVESDSNSTTILDEMNLNGVIDIVSNDEAFAAILSNGDVVSWGNVDYGGGLEQGILDDVVQIFATESAFASLNSTGAVYQWGKTYEIEATIVSVPSLMVEEGAISVHSTSKAFAAVVETQITLSGTSEIYIGSIGTTLESALEIANDAVMNTEISLDSQQTFTTVQAWGHESFGGKSNTAVLAFMNGATGTTPYSECKSHADLSCGIVSLHSTDFSFAAVKSDLVDRFNDFQLTSINSQLSTEFESMISLNTDLTAKKDEYNALLTSNANLLSDIAENYLSEEQVTKKSGTLILWTLIGGGCLVVISVIFISMSAKQGSTTELIKSVPSTNGVGLDSSVATNNAVIQSTEANPLRKSKGSDSDSDSSSDSDSDSEPIVENTKAHIEDDDDSTDWQAIKDEEGNTYYWNSVSNETTWDKPPGFNG